MGGNYGNRKDRTSVDQKAHAFGIESLGISGHVCTHSERGAPGDSHREAGIGQARFIDS